MEYKMGIVKRFIGIFVFFLSMIVFAENFIQFRFNDKYGLLDKNLNIICENNYSSITCINDYIFLKSNGDIECRNSSFQLLDVISPEYARFFYSVNYLYDDFYVFHGYSADVIYNVKDKTRFKIKKITSNAFNEETLDLLPVYSEGYFYSIQSQEKLFEDKEFEKVYPFSNNLAVVLKNNWKKAIIDRNGEIIVDDIINCGWQFKDGLLSVITKDNSGFIDTSGKFVFECEIFDENKNDNVGGNPTIWCFFSEGLSYIHNSESYYMLVDKNWNLIKNEIPYFTKSRIGFSEGYIPVYLNKKYGYLGTTGELFTSLIFDSAGDYYNGYACVIYQGKDGVIDRKGNIYFSEDLMAGKKNPINICAK